VNTASVQFSSTYNTFTANLNAELPQVMHLSTNFPVHTERISYGEVNPKKTWQSLITATLFVLCHAGILWCGAFVVHLVWLEWVNNFRIFLSTQSFGIRKIEKKNLWHSIFFYKFTNRFCNNNNNNNNSSSKWHTTNVVCTLQPVACSRSAWS
jgi:hypothetical protein